MVRLWGGGGGGGMVEPWCVVIKHVYQQGLIEPPKVVKVHVTTYVNGKCKI